MSTSHIQVALIYQRENLWHTPDLFAVINGARWKEVFCGCQEQYLTSESALNQGIRACANKKDSRGGAPRPKQTHPRHNKRTAQASSSAGRRINIGF